MPLTRDELADLERMFVRMEKGARAWAIARWFALALGVVWLALGAWFFVLLHKAWRVWMSEGPSAYVDAHELWAMCRAAVHICPLWLFGVLLSILGGWMTISSLARWRKGRQDALLIKMARSWMESQTA